MGYESPTTNIFEVRVSKIVCTSPTNESMEEESMVGGWVIE